jgi:hypothetical protein
MTIKMSQLDLFISFNNQIINDDFLWNCIKEFFEWVYTTKSITEKQQVQGWGSLYEYLFADVFFT